MDYQEIIKQLKRLANPRIVEGMARYGINSRNILGISIPDLRTMAKKIGKDHPSLKLRSGRYSEAKGAGYHSLAQKLWASGIHEARMLASMIDEVEMVTEKQMEHWVKDFDSWGVCDQVCMNLFDRTKFVYKKVIEWSKREEEFVKRAGFALMACLAVHNKDMNDKEFEKFLPVIKRESVDSRNLVKKAVNWALRQIGKRNVYLNKQAIQIAKEIQKIESKSAKWIAADALRELTGPAIQRRLK